MGDRMATDEELLETWRAGDRLAGNELFQRHFDAIHRFFVNKVDRDVEDLVQRTFIACVEGRDRFQHRSTFRTYLFAVAHNVLKGFFRERRRNERIDFDDRSAADLGAGAVTLLGAKQQQRLLLEGLRRIPFESQVLLELYYWEKLPGAQLGEIFGVPEDTARSRIRRAKRQLLEALRGLSTSKEVLDSTISDLEAWAASIRAGPLAGVGSERAGRSS